MLECNTVAGKLYVFKFARIPAMLMVQRPHHFFPANPASKEVVFIMLC